MNYIDAHCHIQEKEFDADRDKVIGRMQVNHVGGIVIGTDLESSKRAVSLANEHEELYATIGQHPTDVPNEDFNESEYEALLGERVVGVGECGLDYFRTKKEESDAEKERQTTLFKKQIDFALAHNLPLMLHCRPTPGTMDAYEEVLAVLEEYAPQQGEKLRGNVHFFVGTKEVAERFVALGFTLSFTGVVTFAQEYDDVLARTPLSHILSETDSPYAAPIPHRGTRNEPMYVIKVVDKIVEIRGENRQEVKEALVANAKRVFGLS